METVSVERTYDASPQAVEAAMADRQAFMAGAGFDAVTVDGDDVHIENTVGLISIELDVVVVDRPDGVFAYEQVDGIFEDMETTYELRPTETGTNVVAETTYAALDLPVLGSVIDASVVARQRRKELEAQFDWLAEQLAEQ